MSNFAGLNTALSGLRAAQIGLDTAANNVSNASTPGYTRQRLTLREAASYDSPVGRLGSGVTIEGVHRLRDGFVDVRMRLALAQSGAADVSAQLLRRAEVLSGEPENGLSTVLGGVWAALEDLAIDPAGGAPRRQLLSALDAFAGRVRSIATGYRQLEETSAQQRDERLREVNQLLGEVATLNETIRVEERTGVPNDLLDARDLALDRLAQLVGADAQRRPDGTVDVAIGGVGVVTGATAGAVVLRADGGLAVDVAGTTTDVVAGGEVSGIVRFLTDAVDGLPALRSGLAAFATAVADALNSRHAAGQDLSDPPQMGGDLLVWSSAPGGDILTSLQVRPEVHADPRLIAARTPGAGPHDGGNAHTLAALRRDPVSGGASLDDVHRSAVTALASRVAASQREARAQQQTATAASSARSSAHGVSIDEEMASVVQFQRSLEAVSRVMTAIDEALNTLINRTGIVGR